MPPTEIPLIHRLQFKIIAVLITVLVLPLGGLLALLRGQLTDASLRDRDRRLGYAGLVLRERLEDQIELLRIRAKTLADFSLYGLGRDGWNEQRHADVLERELLKANADVLAVVGSQSRPVLQVGQLPEGLAERVLPVIRRFPLSSNLFVHGEDLWIVAAAEITKLRAGGPWHGVLGYHVQREFCDRLRAANGAEMSLIHGGRRRVTTLVDVYGKRMVNSVVSPQRERVAAVTFSGIPHYVLREEALPGQLAEPVGIEVAIPQAEFGDLTRQVSRYFAIFGAVGLLFASLTGWILSWSIVDPLVRVTIWTTRVARGDFQLEALRPRSDEIGLLSENFRKMVGDLDVERRLKEHRMRELTTLFEISNAVNFLTDSEELLKFILSRAIEILNAERGSIMLLDDRTDELMLKVATGGRYRLVTSKPIKFGYGICGLVAKEGTGRIANDGFRSPDFRNFGSLVAVDDIRNLICSPLRFKEGTIGVINIVNRRDDGFFGENDLKLLNLIASQAAVTIENNKLYELSITDGLTRLMVHRYFQARLGEELLRARRYSLKLSLIMVDIDNFKRFNDTYGHQIGDQVLQRVAQTVRETIRTGADIPCRYGGEELAVILPETRAEEAFKLAERLRENIAINTVSTPMGELQITCSLGVASYPTHAHDQQSLIAAVDRALYRSKGTGKNRTTMWEPEEPGQK